MRFLVDAQLPPALARMLAERGHEAVHVIDIGPADAPDGVLRQYALDNDAVIITKDEDFADLMTRSDTAPAVVWIHVGNTSRRALLDWFTPVLGSIVEMLNAGDRLIELQ